MVYKRGKFYYLKQMVSRRRLHVCLYETDPRKAAQKAERLIREARDGAPDATTVAEWWERYEATYTVGKLALGGQKNDRRALRRLVKMWGPRPLSSITVTDCLEWQHTMLKEFAPNTVRTDQGVIGAVFQAAVKDKKLTTNPWKGLRRPRETRRTRVVSGEEQRKLLRQLLPHHDVTVRVLLGTGLRMHELLAFKPTDIQGDNLHVVGKGRKKRVIPLQAEVKALLLQLSPVNHRVFGEAMERATLRAKIPMITPHDLRRTFATRCALAGMPALVLARILGHSSIRTTEQYYVHVDEGAAAAALAKVNLGVAEVKPGKILQHGGPRLPQE